MAIRKKRASSAESAAAAETELRIIGGKYRGSRLRYHGGTTTRPMKHRVREAIFDLLGTDVKGKHAIDLFAGTGAIGLEAISRGATSCTFIEKHVPASRVVQENIDWLDLADRCEMICSSAFLWGREADFPTTGERGLTPWVVFCSPPYQFYVERQDKMLQLIATLIDHAPADSVFVVEADERFDFELLPTTSNDDAERVGPRAPLGSWRVREYPPAHVGILRMD